MRPSNILSEEELKALLDIETELSEVTEPVTNNEKLVNWDQQLLNLYEVVKSLKDRIEVLDNEVSKLRLELTLSSRVVQISPPEDPPVSRSERHRKKDKRVWNKLF